MLVFATVCNAQVASFEEFKTAFNAAKTTTGGGNIVLAAAITVNETFECSSSVDNPVTIGTLAAPTTFQIIVGADGNLTIGENVSIYTTLASCVNVAVGGTLLIKDGCTIQSTASRPVEGNGGTVTIDGGTIFTSNHPAIQANHSLTTVTINGGNVYSANPGTLTRGLIVQNGGKAIINGGTISADPSVSGRGVGLLAGTLIVNGGTISAAGTSGRGIQGDDNGALIYINGGTIKAENVTGSDGGVVLQKNSRAIINGGTFVCPANKALVVNPTTFTPKFYDFRAIVISANPDAGQYAEAQTVTLISNTTASTIYNTTGVVQTNFAEGAAIRYTQDGTIPDMASSIYSTPLSVSIPSVVKAVAEKDGFIGSITTFNYTSPTTSIKQSDQKSANINTVIYESIDLSGIDGIKKLEILNISGQMVSMYQNPSSYISASDLKQGIYILKITTIEGSWTQKVVKR